MASTAGCLDAQLVTWRQRTARLGTHVYAGDQTVVREVNTCACILEEAPSPAGPGPG